MYTLADPIARAESQMADRIAITDASEQRTFGELADRCRRIAGALDALGLERG